MHAQALHTTVVQPRTPATVVHPKTPDSSTTATANHSGIHSNNNSSGSSGCCAKCAPLLRESNANMLKLRAEVDGIISDVAAAQSKDAKEKQVKCMHADTANMIMLLFL
jgi:hypothetical protein